MKLAARSVRPNNAFGREHISLAPFGLLVCLSLAAPIGGCEERAPVGDDFGRTFTSHNSPPPAEVVAVIELWRLKKAEYESAHNIMSLVPSTADLIFRFEGDQAKIQASIMNDVLVNDVLPDGDRANVVWRDGSKIAEKYIFAVTRNDGVRIRMRMTVVMKDGKATGAEFIIPSSSVYFLGADTFPRMLSPAK